MAEKDATARLRRAVKENNLFLVKRLIQRTDMRNPDPTTRRYTSLAWAAVLGHEETFEYLLAAGHDDEELSKDTEGNTILMLLADTQPSASSPYTPPGLDTRATLRMARLYYDRYSDILDWSNVHGKTALHIAALKGNEELVRMLCDLGADFDLADNEGNIPLHYASAWGHVHVVQLLIERGCQFNARNNEGFTAADYAYSYNTKDTLEGTVRILHENNKKSRRIIFAQAAARGNEWGSSSAPVNVPPVPPKSPRSFRKLSARDRSGSGTSRTTATSDSGDMEGGLTAGYLGNSQSSISASSSPSHSQPSAHSASGSVFVAQQSGQLGHGSPGTGGHKTLSPGPQQSSSLHPGVPHAVAALSPIASRMRERDADAMEKYMRRNRSGSASTDTKSQNGSTFSSAGPSANGDDITSLSSLPASATATPRRRLRPSVSAAQLRTQPSIITTDTSQEGPRSRSGTNPNTVRPSGLLLSPLPSLARSASTHSQSPRSLSNHEEKLFEEPESFTGPPSQYAQFPEPPPDTTSVTNSSTPTGRRLPFHLLSKPLPSIDSPAILGHRRGSSTTSIR